MKQKNYNVIGVMSGTSLDGVDLAYLNFFKTDVWHYQILKAETISYSDFWFKKLSELVNFNLDELKNIDESYTKFLAEVISEFIKKHHILDIDAVCSHGHTALHKPEEGLTYQIGNLPDIASLLSLKVVCDFRTQDVKLGGQGAPLVPIGDQLLFSKYCACINLGGFSNISKTINNQRIAFDICPVNIALNHYVSQINLSYDKDGDLASKGTIHKELYAELNQLEFYKKEHPKSLGLEWVKEIFLPIIDNYNLELKDILCTVVEHVAFQIAKEIEGLDSVLFTGGGVYNTFLMQRIQHYTITKICIPEDKLIEFKEALIFGFLGVLKLENQVNCLASVTGASKNHSSGEVFKTKL